MKTSIVLDALQLSSNPLVQVPIADKLPNVYTDQDDQFPSDGLELLICLGLMTLNVPVDFDGQGAGNCDILETLKEVGTYDLSLGRIYEGHINAISLIENFGTPAQKESFFRDARAGKLFGIWNSELPSEPLSYRPSDEGYRLRGSKVFCSGASHVHRPIVTAEGPAGSQMVVLQLNDYELEEDYSYWRPMGMKSSVSCRFDFSGTFFGEGQILGGPYDYVREPDFTGGAIRFAAVQLGGAHAAVRATVRHLRSMKRTESPEQNARLGRLAILLETGDLWLKGAGRAMDNKSDDGPALMHYANMFRTGVREICEEVLKICEMCVGLQGMMEPHPLERIHRDLSTYLKQPGPDRALSAVGRTFTETYPD